MPSNIDNKDIIRRITRLENLLDGINGSSDQPIKGLVKEIYGRTDGVLARLRALEKSFWAQRFWLAGVLAAALTAYWMVSAVNNIREALKPAEQVHHEREQPSK